MLLRWGIGSVIFGTEYDVKSRLRMILSRPGIFMVYINQC